jgi:sugar phosphate isomerase/epimerase
LPPQQTPLYITTKFIKSLLTKEELTGITYVLHNVSYTGPLSPEERERERGRRERK